MAPPLELDARSTKFYLFTNAELRSSPLLEPTWKMINDAFTQGHPPWLPGNLQRFSKPADIPIEIKTGSFTYVLTIPPSSSNDEEIVVATGTGRPNPYHRSSTQPITEEVVVDRKQGFDLSREFAQPVQGVEDWEIKLLCVDPKYMRKGIAKRIMSMLETEVRRRVKAGDNANRARIVLSTIDEQNGKFYRMLDYIPVDADTKPIGFYGSETGFTFIHMHKYLE